MTSDRWKRLNRVFGDALDAPAGERQTRAAQACGDDEKLRAEAISMISAAEQSGDFLETSAIETLAHEVAAGGWSLRPGERVGVYRVDWLLGSGGSGEVWRAHDERLGRDVAIKVLLPHFASDADRLRRFQQEARAAGALNHANILAVYDVGEHRGAPFLVSECLEGQSLRKRLEQGPLSVDDTLAIASQITRGLAAAHARGIIHRDLKPDNVFLRSDGGVKILDLGLAKLRAAGAAAPGDAAETITGVIAGTPAYMAPEQVRGGDVDPRADLFALGAMLYEMLGGRRPFLVGSTVETLHAILTVEPPPIAGMCPDVTPAVAHIVHRCLEKSPDDRFRSAEELATALDTAMDARRRLSTTQSLSVLGASAAATRLGPFVIVAHQGRGTVGDIYRARDTSRHRDVLVEVFATEDLDNPTTQLQQLREEMSAWAALDHPHLAAIYGLEEIERFHVLVLELVEGRPLMERIERSPLAIEHALTAARQIAAALEAIHDHGLLHGDLNPTKVVVQPDGTVKLLKFGVAETASAIRAVYRSPEQARGEQFDRRADLWAFGCVLFEMLAGRAAYPIEDSPTAATRVNAHEPEWGSVPPNVPPPIRALLHRCLQRDLARRFRDVGDARLELEQPTDAAWAVTHPTRAGGWATRWAWLLAIGALGVAAVVVTPYLSGRQAARGSATTMQFISVTNFAGVESQPTLSPDGRSVAFVSNRQNQWDIYVALVSGGNLVQITNDPNVEIGPQWSPDGARLLFARVNDKGLTDVWIVPAFGGTARRVLLNAATPAWSPDGGAIAFRARRDIWIADTDGGNAHAITHAEPAIIQHTQPAFSHDGQRLVIVRQLNAQRSELAIANARTGELRDLTGDGALALSPVWSPDDRFIYFTSSRGGTLSTWKIPSTSGEAEAITAGQDDNEDIDLSVDGRRLAFSSSRTNIGLAEMSLDPASLGRVTWLTRDSARGETAPRFSPDGNRIAYFTNRNSLERDTLWTMDADGGNASRALENGRFNIHPRWTPDGQRLIFASRADGRSAERVFELWQLPLSGGAPVVLPVKPFNSTWGDVAPDGRLIYRTSARAGEIFDPRTNQRQAVPNLLGDPWWGPDGRWFVFAVPPWSEPPSDGGVWMGTPEGARRQIFSGWVLWCAVSRAGDVLILEGKASLKGVLWRTDARGEHRTAVGEVPLLLRHNELSAVRFDVHPDGRRIVFEARPVFESDIGVIDHVR